MKRMALIFTLVIGVLIGGRQLGLVVANYSELSSAQITDGGGPIPPAPTQVADGGGPIPPAPTQIADGGGPIPPALVFS